MLKLDPKNTELLNQKQTVLNKSIETTQDKLKQLQEIKEKADSAMQNGTKINEENYRSLQREIINTQNKLSDLKNQASNWTKAGDALIKWGENFDKISSKIDSLGNKLTTRLTAPITAVAGLGLKYNAEIEKYASSFETFLGDVQEAEKAVNNIKKDASKTPFDVTSLVKANQMLVSTGENAEDARKVINALGDAVTATGGGNDELTRMASNLQQIKNAGKATSMDIRQFAYAGIDIYGILANYLGKTTQEIKGMEISYNDLSKALKRANGQGGKYYGAMEKSSKTLTGQVNQLKAETMDMLGELTKSLMPVAKKVISKVKEVIKWFNDLSDAEKNNIVKIGLMVAAAGPLLKVLSSGISIIGGVTKGVGTFTKAVALAHNGIGTATGSTADLAQKLIKLNNPIALTVAGITGLIAAFTAYEVATKNEKASLGGLREEIQNQINSFKKLGETRNNVLSNSLGEIEVTEKLVDELKQITDENGKVKKGYEDRAKIILGNLNNALGTEYKMNGNIIESYKNIESEIDKLIAKKKAEAVLNAYSEEYTTAMTEQEKAVQSLVKLKEKLKETTEKMTSGNAKERAEAELLYGSIQKQIKDQTELVGSYGKVIQDYHNLESASAKNSAKDIDEAISKIGISYKNLKEKSDTTLEEQIKNQGIYVKNIRESLTEAKNANDGYQVQILENQLNASQKQLDELIDSLTKQTSEVEKLTPEQIEAWKYAAEQSYSKYSEGLNKVPPKAREKIEEATGVVSVDGEKLSTAFKNTAGKSTILFSETLDFKKPTKTEITDTSSILSKDTKVEGEAEKLAGRAEKAVESNNSNEWGQDMVDGIASGIRSAMKGGFFTGALTGLASKMSSYLHFSRPDKGPLHEYEKWMPDMVKGLSKTLLDASPILEKTTKLIGNRIKDDFNIIDFEDYGKLHNQIIDKTKAVSYNVTANFYPQHMTDSEMDKAFNYLNKKMGSYFS